MAKTKEKDFNAMLHDSKDMPKVKELTAPEVIKRYGGSKMLLAPPIEYDTLIKNIEKGRTKIKYFVKGYENFLADLEK